MPAPDGARQLTGKVPTEHIRVLEDSSVKTYMSVWTITDPTSNQYRYIHESGEVKIDERGYLTTDDGYRGAALGSALGDIGERFIFTLSSGVQLKIVKVEEKADHDTDNNNFAAVDNGDVIEFVIDETAAYMQENVGANGLVFSGNFNNCPDFQGEIIKIEKIKEGLYHDEN